MSTPETAITCQEDLSEETAKGQELAVTDSTVNELTSKYARLTLSDTELVFRLHQAKKSQTEIAQIVGCSQSTVSNTLAKLAESPALTQALLRADSTERLKDWKRASRIAAKRGDHRPAREWLEAAHPELRPAAANSAGGGGVVINIGTLEPPAIQVVSPQSGEP